MCFKFILTAKRNKHVENEDLKIVYKNVNSNILKLNYISKSKLKGKTNSDIALPWKYLL